jgi:hypothetical protein
MSNRHETGLNRRKSGLGDIRALFYKLPTEGIL